MEATKEAKVEIVENQLSAVINSIYLETINNRVGQKVKDDNMIKKSTAALKKLEMMNDEYTAILKELEPKKAE